MAPGDDQKRSRKGTPLRKPSPSQPGDSPHVSVWTHALIILGLILACLALYRGTFDLGFFTLDDPDYIQNNPYLSSVSGTNLHHMFTTPYFANYAPGHLLSYAADIKIAGGKNATAMHVSNVLWYAWCACMVYMLGFTLLRNPFAAGASALLFIVHPAHVEVVAWLSSRKDLVATGFAVLAAVCYVRYRRTVRMRYPWYGASLLCFLLASSGKQSVVLLPAVLLAWDIFWERRRDWWMVPDKVPYGLITFFFSWMTWLAQPATKLTPNLYVLATTELTNLWLLSGFGQYVMYRPRPNPETVNAALELGIIAMAALFWLVPVLLHRFRRPLAGALSWWVLIQMVPPMVLSFMTPITDRYLFLPSVAACLLLGGLAVPSPSPNRNRITTGLVWATLAFVSCVWTWQTAAYLREWSDPRSVWFFAAAKVKSPQACEYSGSVYQEAAERVQGYLRSGQLPTLTNDLRLAKLIVDSPDTLSNLQAEWTGTLSSRTNSIAYRERLWSLAWNCYEEAVAHRGTLNTPNLFLRRGGILVNQGKHEEAIREFQTGLSLTKTHTYAKVRAENSVHLQRAVGVAYWNLKRYGEARDWLQKAQSTQRQSGQTWIPTLDQEVEKVLRLAATEKPPAQP